MAERAQRAQTPSMRPTRISDESERDWNHVLARHQLMYAQEHPSSEVRQQQAAHAAWAAQPIGGVNTSLPLTPQEKRDIASGRSSYGF